MKRIGLAAVALLLVMLIPIFLAHGDHTKREETLGDIGQTANSVAAVTNLEGVRALL